MMALVAALAVAGGAGAQEAVKIGILMPLSGNAASAGQQSKAAIELATEIINSPHPGMGSLPPGAGAGLPNLKRAQIELVAAAHQGNPSVRPSHAPRPIQQEKPPAL